MGNYLSYVELGDICKLILYLNDEFQVIEGQSELAAEVILTDANGERIGVVKPSGTDAGFALYPEGM